MNEFKPHELSLARWALCELARLKNYGSGFFSHYPPTGALCLIVPEVGMANVKLFVFYDIAESAVPLETVARGDAYALAEERRAFAKGLLNAHFFLKPQPDFYYGSGDFAPEAAQEIVDNPWTTIPRVLLAEGKGAQVKRLGFRLEPEESYLVLR